MSEEISNIFRRVYFFRISHFSEVKDSLPDALRRIASLEFNDSGRYKVEAATGVRYSVYPDTEHYPLRIRFGKIKRDALPQVESEGQLANLELQENQGLIDLCHVIIYEDGIVAAEWNPDGPKLALLGSYIFEKGRINTPLKFLSLYERDIIEILEKLNTVKVFEVALAPDGIELAREADKDLARAIEATTRLGATKKSSLILTADKPSPSFKALAISFAGILKQRPQEASRVSTLAIKGYTPGSRSMTFIDLLESKLLAGEYFTRTDDRARSLKSDDAYKTIEQIVSDNQHRIMSAASTQEGDL